MSGCPAGAGMVGRPALTSRTLSSLVISLSFSLTIANRSRAFSLENSIRILSCSALSSLNSSALDRRIGFVLSR